MNAATKTQAERRATAATWAGYRQASFARSTGTLVVVCDDREQGLESDPTVGRWVTICDDHDSCVFHLTLAVAIQHASAPEGWCDSCAELVARKAGEPVTVIAAPYEARQCPRCETWVYCAGGPFSEGDRTKTLADWNHWERHHLADADRAGTSIGFPYFPWNQTPVEATKEV
jgi:hypothetical protein